MILTNAMIIDKYFFRSGVEFQVYLTKSSGEKLKKRMDAENISCILVEDMGIGYIINQGPDLMNCEKSLNYNRDGSTTYY